MGTLFDDPEFPDYVPFPSLMLEAARAGVSPILMTTLLFSLMKNHEEVQGMVIPLPQHQPEPPHQEIALIAGPAKALVEALPPTTNSMPPLRNQDGSDVVIRMHWDVQRRASQVAANSTTMSSAALWFQSTQAAQSTTT
jgi:hypothetical protein